MSLIKYGIAAALGYYFGQPQGRKQLQQVRQQVILLSQRPQVKQLQASARERALAAKDRAATTMARKKESADPTPVDPTPLGDTAPISTPEPARTDSAPTGFGGRTVAEDSEAARTGLVPPPPRDAPRRRPRRPGPDLLIVEDTVRDFRNRARPRTRHGRPRTHDRGPT